MVNYCEKYGYTPDVEEVGGNVARIAAGAGSLKSRQVLMDCFSMMDLTTLKTNDTPASVTKLVQKVNAFAKEYPAFPLPASVCVYSNFASVVRDVRDSKDLHVTVVSACFPSAQSFLEVKVRECELAVENGADEVDIVLALNSFLAGDYDGASAEIRAVREAIDRVAASQGREVHLKVILETGLLPDAAAIANASFLAMEAGADFIKTSTGKVDVNATPEAAYVMCRCIAAYYAKTGKKIGFKPAGGMSTAADALRYYSIVSDVLGRDWLNKDLFRFGVSRMANNLLSEIEGKELKIF